MYRSAVSVVVAALASCAPTTLDASDFDTKCAKNSDCAVVYLGNMCNGSCTIPETVNVSALDDVHHAIQAARGSCLPQLGGPVCVEMPAVHPTCKSGVCNEPVQNDPSDPNICADDSNCTGAP
jgi:hypothetical protein